MKPDQDVPTILFGAFDRHNFGDLLFPHIVAAQSKSKDLIFAGLAERDLRAHGGHRVRSLARLAAELGGRPVDIVHAGGELLTCDAWQAAVMLQPAERVQETIRYFEARPGEKTVWARVMLGVDALAPYTVPRRLFPGARKVRYNAVGGVDLDRQDAALRAEVLAKLADADEVSVRDKYTLAQLDAAGIAARLVPDPAAQVAALFGDRIDAGARQGEVGEIVRAFPQGYAAVQFSADFGDDGTLAEIAGQLDQAAMASGAATVFFRAGAAPWHDDLDCYRRTAARMKSKAVRIFESLDIWDICALISRCRAYCGSSLHGRIVAGAFGLPRINLVRPSDVGRVTKQAAYAETWDMPAMPMTVGVGEIVDGIRLALMAGGE